MPKPWMLYGANGYTGELIAREAVSRGLKPVLAHFIHEVVREELMGGDEAVGLA